MKAMELVQLLQDAVNTCGDFELFARDDKTKEWYMHQISERELPDDATIPLGFLLNGTVGLDIRTLLQFRKK